MGRNALVGRLEKVVVVSVEEGSKRGAHVCTKEALYHHGLKIHPGPRALPHPARPR